MLAKLPLYDFLVLGIIATSMGLVVDGVRTDTSGYISVGVVVTLLTLAHWSLVRFILPRCRGAG